MEQGIDVFNEKVPVLEVAQQAHHIQNVQDIVNEYYDIVVK